MDGTFAKGSRTESGSLARSNEGAFIGQAIGRDLRLPTQTLI